MSWWQALIGSGSQLIDGTFEGVAKIIDESVTSKEEKYKILQELSKAQIELNKQEAGHRSIFVAGWRPFVGWVCAFALMYNFITKDIINYVLVIKYPSIELLPSLQMEHLMTVLLGMLGLGGLRTLEKVKNKTR